MKTRYRACFEMPSSYYLGPVHKNIGDDQYSPQKDKDGFLFEILAESPEEAMAIYQLRLGFGAFMPMGDPEPCPKCGAIHYPIGSSVCWRCGPVGYESCPTEPIEPIEFEGQVDYHGRYTYRAYLDASGATELFSLDDEAKARAAGIIPPSAIPLWEIEVDTPEEAMTIYRLRTGQEPYTPKGESAKCPKCGAVYYPEDSSVCWRCGPVD